MQSSPRTWSSRFSSTELAGRGAGRGNSAVVQGVIRTVDAGRLQDQAGKVIPGGLPLAGGMIGAEGLGRASAKSCGARARALVGVPR